MTHPSLHGVIVFVTDLEAGRAFYCDVLGFELVREGATHHELRGADFDLTLFGCDSSASPEGYSARAGSSIAFAVADLEGEVERLTAAGVTILHEAPAVGPIGRYVAFADPFGTVHELVEPT